MEVRYVADHRCISAVVIGRWPAWTRFATTAYGHLTCAGLRAESTNFNQVLITGYHVDGKLRLLPAGIVIAPDYIVLLWVALTSFIDCQHRVEAAAA
ncbi:hypothetical protein ES703_89370 [subsurface metagenome]